VSTVGGDVLPVVWREAELGSVARAIFAGLGSASRPMCGRLWGGYRGDVRAYRRLAAWLRSRPFVADSVLAGAITLYVQQDTWTNDWVGGWSLPAYAITGLAMTLPLALRRR
jgi:hypothetical protein